MSNKQLQHKSAPVVSTEFEYHGKALNPNQRVFGTIGSSLQTAEGMTQERIDAGLAGERRVGLLLESIAAQYPNMYVFHSVKLFGSVADIDHVVVQGNQVMLVDTKNWQSGRDYSVRRVDNESDVVFRDDEPFEGGKIYLKKYMKEFREKISWDSVGTGTKWSVDATLVIANPTTVTYTASFGHKSEEYYQYTNIRDLYEVIRKHFANSVDDRPLSYDKLRYFADLVQRDYSQDKANGMMGKLVPYRPNLGNYNTSQVSVIGLAIFVFVVGLIGLLNLPVLATLLGVAGIAGCVYYLVSVRPVKHRNKKTTYFNIWFGILILFSLNNLIGIF